MYLYPRHKECNDYREVEYLGVVLDCIGLFEEREGLREGELRKEEFGETLLLGADSVFRGTEKERLEERPLIPTSKFEFRKKERAFR